MEMDRPAQTEEERSPFLTWGIVSGIAAAFFIWGMAIFYGIGDKGPPIWDFGVVPDVPGEAVYSTHTPFRPHGLVPGPYPGHVDPQHVLGPTAETQRMEIMK